MPQTTPYGEQSTAPCRLGSRHGLRRIFHARQGAERQRIGGAQPHRDGPPCGIQPSRLHFYDKLTRARKSGALIGLQCGGLRPHDSRLPSVPLMHSARCFSKPSAAGAPSSAVITLSVVRADEVTRLGLESMDRHRDTLNVYDTKGKRAHCMPLPLVTGHWRDHHPLSPR